MIALLSPTSPLLWTQSFVLATAEADESYTKAVTASLLVVAGLVFLLSVLLGELCTRLKLPSVLGDLATGMILGGSILSILVFADVDQVANGSILHLLELATGASPDTVMDAYQFQMQEFINTSATIGLLTLLFVTGLESDLEELIRVGPQAATVAVTGVFLPLVGGATALIYLFHVPTIPAIFAGAALTATSIGITANVLQEIGHLQSNEGQVILGAAILDDILGIVVLALTLSLVETGSIEPSSLIMLVISAAVFVLLAILLNRYFCPIFTSNIERFDNPAALLLCSFAFLNVMAVLAIAFGLEALLGAFAAGLVLGGTSQKEKLMRLVQPFVFVYTTIFFVTIGASVNLNVLNPLVPENREGLVIAACLIAIAVIGKVVAGFTAFGDKPINRLAVGIGMIPRGEVGLVFAGLGASTGVLSESLGAAVLIMVVVTTLIAPLLLRWVFPSQPETLTADTAKRFAEIEEAVGDKF